MTNYKQRSYELLLRNFTYVKEQGYEGYDPKIYDYMPMTSRTSFNPSFINKVFRRFEIEIFRRRFPNLLLPYLNIFDIEAKTTIPYGLGVFMQCYSLMYRIKKDESFLEEAHKVAKLTEKMLIPTTKGLGIPNPSKGKVFKYKDGVFDDNAIFLPGGSEVFFGFYDLYKVSEDQNYFKICQKIVEAFMSEFQQKKLKKNIIVLDYSNSGDNSHVLNANALAMSCIAIMYKETKEEKYKLFAQKIYNYILPYLSYENIPYTGIEDKERNKGWLGCDTYHTGFTLRGMYETAEILGFDKKPIISKIKEMMQKFVIGRKIIIYKGLGQRGLLQDAHALAEYIRIFATFYDYFDSDEQVFYTKLIFENIESFIYEKGHSYFYTVNKEKKFYLYMPRWVHAPMMNSLALLYGKL